jgi:pantothenate kinase type III
VARILAIDRGNQSLKLALVDSNVIIARWRSPIAQEEALLSRIALASVLTAPVVSGAPRPGARRSRGPRHKEPSIELHGVIVSSVDRRWMGKMRGLLEKTGARRIIEVSSKMKFPFEILVDRPSTVGSDRLAAAAGVIAAGNREAIIVDAGTAITVDTLSERGFLGGAIFPGRDLLCRVLHEGTAALPLVSDRGGAVEPPGRNTKEAILAGVRWGVIGAVRELVHCSRRRVSKGAGIWVTGGGGAAIAAHVGSRVRNEPDLIFHGLRLLFELDAG